MTQQLQYTFFSSSTPEAEFDAWFEEEREPFLEDDVDETEEDDYGEDDYE